MFVADFPYVLLPQLQQDRYLKPGRPIVGVCAEEFVFALQSQLLVGQECQQVVIPTCAVKRKCFTAKRRRLHYGCGVVTTRTTRGRINETAIVISASRIFNTST